MNKKYLQLVVLLLAISVLVASCNTRDLSTPSTRIVGHWGLFEEGTSDPTVEWYFGEVDEESIGSLIALLYGDLDDSNDDESFFLQYRVISENGDTVTINFIEEGDDFTFPRNFEVSKDGQSLIDVEFEEMGFQYIDSSTEP
jgi:hypothetical protein